MKIKWKHDNPCPFRSKCLRLQKQKYKGKPCPFRARCSKLHFELNKKRISKKVKFIGTWRHKVVNPNYVATIKTKKSRTPTQEDYQQLLLFQEKYNVAKDIIRALIINLREKQCRLASAWKLLYGWTQPIPPFGHMNRTRNFLKKKPQW